MSKQNREVIRAFLRGQAARSANTFTEGSTLYLYKSPIVRRHTFGYKVSLCGYPTPTTRDRLNTFFQEAGLDYKVYQRQGQNYINNEPISSQQEVFVA